MNLSVDLNADLGEGAAGEGELLALVSSANIACGFHAGDPGSMTASILAAKAAGVAVGAHPGLADRENFGRRELPVTPGEVFALVTNQVGAFQAVATSLGVRPNHVKPHGALYNMAARDPALAEAVTNAILAVDRRLLLFAPAGSALARAAAAIALRVAREVFADRNYLPDGSLVPRTRPDALLHDAEEAAERVLRMLRENVVRAVDGSDVPLEVDTICLHGDKPEAVAFAQKLRAQLSAAGVKVAALSN
ncbi:MAG: LamB/YcsF family protein [Chthoniobacterales bacterium]|nr:LamB/YcsF family protein [Chthoniobacterales bacterium]